MSKRAVLVLAVSILLAGGVRAGAETYTFTLDPAATEVSFLLDAFLHQVHGTAKLARGAIRFDGDSGAAEGEVVVDATSAETGNEKRDRDMHVKVLESAQHAQIVLVVDGYEGRFDPAAPSDVVVKARLRLHGAEHPLRLDFSLTPKDGRLDAKTTFVVPYVGWGMKDPSKPFLRVGKEVEVTIDAAGTLAAGG